MMGALHRANISAFDGDFEAKYDATSTAWAPFAVVGTDNKEYAAIYSCWLTYGGFIKKEQWWVLSR